MAILRFLQAVKHRALKRWTVKHWAVKSQTAKNGRRRVPAAEKPLNT